MLIVVDVFIKYGWVNIPLKGVIIVNAFQLILRESNCKRNKTLSDEMRKFYDLSINSSVPNNNIGMYSVHSEGKSVVTKRFIRNFKEWNYINTWFKYQKMCTLRK